MLQIQQLYFSYETDLQLFNDFNFNLEKGEFCSILGKSGSGKSTLLKLIYGLYDWEKGSIYFNGRKLLGPKGNLVPGEPDIKWVAQEFDLMPYTTVGENVGIYFSNIDVTKKETQILKLLKVVDLEEFKDTKVVKLSGGQKQRVAIAKALAEQPKLLLLDEPFSQIDSYLKTKLQRQLYEYIQKNDISVLMVTHNIKDALSFSDRIVILQNGNIIESNTADQIFMHPRHIETAQLLGDVNIINGLLIGEEDRLYFIHSFQIKSAQKGYEATVIHSYYRGNYYMIETLFKGQLIYFQNKTSIEKGETVFLKFKWQMPK